VGESPACARGAAARCDAEARGARAAAHADSEDYRALFELLLSSGLRIGEALGLSVADLDSRHSLIRVEYQLGRDGSRQPLKTDESRRAADIPPELMQRLLHLIDQRGARFTPHALVFASQTGTGLQPRSPAKH
jgi:integrase